LEKGIQKFKYLDARRYDPELPGDSLFYQRRAGRIAESPPLLKEGQEDLKITDSACEPESMIDTRYLMNAG